MTTAATTTLIILLITVILFVSNKLRSDIVALCSLLSLSLFNILTPEEALAGFSSSIVIMMIGLFVVSGAIFETGLTQTVSNKLLALAGGSQFKLFVLVVLTTSVIGAFVSNTGTVALMLPVVVSLAMTAKINSSRLLMPLAFASSIGGMLTLIGTPPNLVINETLIKAGYDGLKMFSFLPVGLVCVALGILLLWPFSKWFLSKKEMPHHDQEKGKTPKSLVNEYHLVRNLYRVRVKTNSLFFGKQLREINLRQLYNVSILEIRRRHERYKFNRIIHQITADPLEIIQENDVLYTMGDFTDIKQMVNDNNLEWVDTLEADGTAPVFSGQLRFEEIGLTEIVVMSNSKLVEQTLADSGFRENYNVNILGIQRNNKYILRGLKNEKIHSGDALLVQGEWAGINRLKKEYPNIVVVGQNIPEDNAQAKLTRKAPLAAAIMLAMVACMSFNLLPPVTAVMIAAILMILTGCLRNVENAYNKINWQSIVLIGAMLPMSVALEKTGISTMISNILVNGLGGYNPVLALAGIYFTTSIMTLFISNTATAVLVAPIAISFAIGLKISPYPFLFAVTVAASMCFASPFSTPPNALVMSAGRYSFIDYVKVGLPMQLIFGLVMIFVLPLLFPF